MLPRWTVLVTGASTGLGLALARRLLDTTEHRLILTARPESLGRFAEEGIEESDRVFLRPLDVLAATARRAVIQEADDCWGGVDVLVNNAGVMVRSVVEHLTDDDRIEQMRVNFVAPMELVRLVLPRMRARRGGRIINVSSVGGMMAMPTMAVYSASKFALEGATEALFYEVRPWNIRVSLVEPGFIHSEAYRNVRFTAMSEHSRDDVHEAYHAHYEHMAPFIERLMRWSRATPQRVARTIVRTMHRRRPPLRVAATIDARLFSALRRLLPRSFYHWMLYRSLPKVRTWGLPRAEEGDDEALALVAAADETVPDEAAPPPPPPPLPRR